MAAHMDVDASNPGMLMDQAQQPLPTAPQQIKILNDSRT